MTTCPMKSIYHHDCLFRQLLIITRDTNLYFSRAMHNRNSISCSNPKVRCLAKCVHVPLMRKPKNSVNSTMSILILPRKSGKNSAIKSACEFRLPKPVHRVVFVIDTSCMYTGAIRVSATGSKTSEASPRSVNKMKISHRSVFCELECQDYEIQLTIAQLPSPTHIRRSHLLRALLIRR